MSDSQNSLQRKSFCGRKCFVTCSFCFVSALKASQWCTYECVCVFRERVCGHVCKILLIWRKLQMVTFCAWIRSSQTIPSNSLGSHHVCMQTMHPRQTRLNEDFRPWTHFLILFLAVNRLSRPERTQKSGPIFGVLFQFSAFWLKC